MIADICVAPDPPSPEFLPGDGRYPTILSAGYRASPGFARDAGSALVVAP